MSTLLLKLKEMFSFQQELKGQTGRLNADSFQKLKELILQCGKLFDDEELILIVDRLGKHLTTLIFNGNRLSDHAYSNLSNCARYCDVIRFSFFCSFCVYVNHVCSVRKTPEWPLYVFFGSYIICSDVGVIWQPSNSIVI